MLSDPISIDKYAQLFTSDELDVLKKLNRETHVKILNPRMLSGHYQGVLLQMISKMIQPQHVLEIGTYTGYSAICFAQGLKPGGLVHTIDVNEELKGIIEKYIAEAKLETRIKTYFGDATEIIPTLDIIVDLVFIDADKENYLTYYNLVFDKVRSGGFILADNVLWDGKVIDPEKYTDSETKAIIAFNEFIKNDNRVEQLFLTVRDGLYLIQKK